MTRITARPAAVARRMVHSLALTLALALPAVGALAADTIFLKLDGIRGESTDARHPNEIVVNSYAQAFRNAANFGFGGGGGGAGRVSCGDITVLKDIDRASPDFIMLVTTGRHIPEGTISFTRQAASGPGQDFYIVRLRDVRIDAVEQIDPPGEGGLREKISLKARQFQFTYYPTDARGALGTPVTFGWDCVSNTRF